MNNNLISKKNIRGEVVFSGVSCPEMRTNYLWWYWGRFVLGASCPDSPSCSLTRDTGNVRPGSNIPPVKAVIAIFWVCFYWLMSVIIYKTQVKNIVSHLDNHWYNFEHHLCLLRRFQYNIVIPSMRELRHFPILTLSIITRILALLIHEQVSVGFMGGSRKNRKKGRLTWLIQTSWNHIVKIRI